MQEMDLKMQEQLAEMELNHDAMEKELDRALEQFRQLEWETKMDEAIEDLKKLRRSKKCWRRNGFGPHGFGEPWPSKTASTKRLTSCAKTSTSWKRTTNSLKTSSP